MHLQKLRALSFLLIALPILASAASVDNASLEMGGGAKVQMVRVGFQKNWEKKYFQSNGTHVAAYWDFSLAQWRGNAFNNVDGQHQNITDIGATPTFRFQSDSMRGWYAEAGVGYHLLSALYNNDNNKLSTAFQFGDHLGAGYVFRNGWEMGMRIQHFSNGGIKKPNSGVNFLVLKLARPF
ncbi:MAG: acyloxyacyl hydrolase [Pseudomonadota bacterium]